MATKTTKNNMKQITAKREKKVNKTSMILTNKQSNNQTNDNSNALFIAAWHDVFTQVTATKKAT